jgi:hypothetical protein
VSIPWRSIAYSSTARKKVLQMDTLKTVRAMRAVFRWMLQQKFVLLADPHLLTSIMALQSCLERR